MRCPYKSYHVSQVIGAPRHQCRIICAQAKAKHPALSCPIIVEPRDSATSHGKPSGTTVEICRKDGGECGEKTEQN